MGKIKAIALFSGGLDSTLAIRVMLEQGIEVEALHFVSAFCGAATDTALVGAPKTSAALGVPVRVIDNTQDFFELVNAPKHGFGSNMNPCIDCKIQMLKRAAQYMRENGASFLITGEVLGQRPMSQRRDALRLIEKESGLLGLIFRPLSARFLEPTLPEQEGWIDREKLPAMRGRGRKPQMALAKAYGITDYPAPAGGCLLTDPEFAHRLRELMSHATLTVNDVHLLKAGRHFRLDPATKAVVGRNEADNDKITALARAGDLLFSAADVPGPTTLLRGELSDANIRAAAELTLLYAKMQGTANVEVRDVKTKATRIIEAGPAEPGMKNSGKMIMVR